jgi:predicted amidohydrolase YtcJ
MNALSRRRFLVAAGLGASACAFGDFARRPDLVLHHGRIWTGAGSDVEALALVGDRVFAAGSNAEVLALAAPGTRRVDLSGRRVTPGFNDAHAHPAASGVGLLMQVTCDQSSLDAIKDAIRARAARTPPAQWIEGAVYDDTKTPRPLSRADLDEAAPAHPVIVRHRGGHTAFVNSRAYAAAGVDERTADPDGGRFFRDEAGRLNGRVADAAVAAFDKLLPEPTRDDWRRGVALISANLARSGVTSTNDASAEPRAIQGYQDARDAGELKTRVYAHVHQPHLAKYLAAGVHSGFGDEWVRLGAVKLFADGSISERTALLAEPYIGLGDYRGLALATGEELYAQAREAHLAGWQIGVHANGDTAIDTVLGVFERLQRESPRRDPRFRIEHCTVVTPALVARMKALGVVPVPFAGYVYFHAEKLHFYGEERLGRMFAMRSFLDAGLRAPSSSDYTASPHEPMLWMRSQVTRTDATGHVWGANQRITAAEALRCGTANGAYAAFEEGIKGTLAPGMLADLVVWSDDPLTIDPMRLLEVRAERTMVGGRFVYEA